MAPIPIKVEQRLLAGIKKFQAILTDVRTKDLNYLDTASIVKDMLDGVFGFDKYLQLSSESKNKPTPDVITVKIDKQVKIVIQVIAIGKPIQDEHVKKFDSESSAEIAIITNGLLWKCCKIDTDKDSTNEMIYEFDFMNLNVNDQNDLSKLYFICHESFNKSELNFYERQTDMPKVLNMLNKDIIRRSNMLFWIGFTVLLICIALASYLYNDIKQALDKQVIEINSAKDGQKALLITVYLIFRVLTLGTIPTALLIFGYNIIKASFDQSIRFAKRQHGALFWQFLHEEYGHFVNDVTFDKFKDAFDAWNKVTESSFTSIKVSSRNYFGNALENITNTLKEIKEKSDKPS